MGDLGIRRTLAHGRAAGFCSGPGAATADGCYGLPAALGLTTGSDLITGRGSWPRLCGGLFLCYLGVQTVRALPAGQAARASGTGPAAMYGSTLLLTLTNPLTILSFTGVAALLSATR